MAIEEQLLNGIDDALGDSVRAGLTSSDVRATLYEAYIYTLVLRAAENVEGVQGFDQERPRITYREVGGRIPSTLIFRKGPGQIYGDSKDFGHAVINFGDNVEIELHKNIMVEGGSTVQHECDVLAIDRAEAETCRQQQAAPRKSRVVIAIECKGYWEANISLGLARAFIGFRSDVSKNSQAYFVTNDTSQSVQRFLTAKANRNWEVDVLPGNERKVTMLKSSFQKLLSEFVIQNS